ncbi:hypothetical protein [Azospirillum sp. SYSU D00513]|uniref:hypothetical protein n=1 Tax=Azospirillum sp. SYSU D00513 TaxID=2812561 RepID=UPI001A96B567|nr:hypothetical protein [Azospirillum sp. SYSU D00513]
MASASNHTASQIISPGQCRAARAFLEWTSKQLAEKAGTAVQTVLAFESTRKYTHPHNVLRLKAAFEAQGIVFNEQGGVNPREHILPVKPKRKTPVKKGARGSTPWTEEEKEILRVHYPQAAIIDHILPFLPGRTSAGLMIQAFKMKLRRPEKPPALTRDQQQAIFEAVASGKRVNWTKLSASLGVEKSVVQSYAKQLKQQSTDETS